MSFTYLFLAIYIRKKYIFSNSKNGPYFYIRKFSSSFLLDSLEYEGSERSGLEKNIKDTNFSDNLFYYFYHSGSHMGSFCDYIYLRDEVLENSELKYDFLFEDYYCDSEDYSYWIRYIV
nr:hypothetical protein [Erythrotrichia foliiformis]